MVRAKAQERRQQQRRSNSGSQSRKKKMRNDTEDEGRFRAQLECSGLRIEVMEGDGNCLFRSLSDQLHGNDNSHVEMREAIVKFEEDEHEHFEHFVEDDEPWPDYVERMGVDGEWGGNIELVAASMLFRVHVVVHQLEAPRFEIRCHEGAKRTIHLSFHGEAHYNSVRSLDDYRRNCRPEGLPQLVVEGTPTLEMQVSRAAPWAPVAAVREALKTESRLDDALELLLHQRTNGTIDTYGVSSSDEDDPPPRQTRRATLKEGKRRNKNGTKKMPDDAPYAKPPQQTRSGPCHCGSGRPYKRCCRPIDMKKARDSAATLEDISRDRPRTRHQDHDRDSEELPAVLGALQI